METKQAVLPLSAPVSTSILLCFGNRHNHITVCDETIFVSSMTLYQQAGRAGTNSRFLNQIFQIQIQNACWAVPNPLSFRIVRCRLRVCSKHFYNKKDSLGLFHEGRVLGYLRLSGLRFFGAALFLCKEQFYVSLCTKKLLHFFFRFTIVRVECFLFRQQLGIFRIQFFHLGELFQVSFIECRFRCLVQCDLCTMTFQKVLAVSGLSVGIIDLMVMPQKPSCTCGWAAASCASAFTPAI